MFNRFPKTRLPKWLKQINLLKGLKKDLGNLKKCFLLAKRERITTRYFKTHSVFKLHLGSNKTVLDGWLCSDLVPKSKQSIFLDVTCKFPFPDQVFDYVYAEHLIEHLDLEQGFFMLQECFRVLKKNGRMRIATPDLDVIVRLYTGRKKNFGDEYIKWSINNFSDKKLSYDPVIVINTLFHHWGHRFLYDYNFIKKCLEKCGFASIERFSYGQSNDIHLQNIEKHHENVGSLEMVKFEALIVEAVKP